MNAAKETACSTCSHLKVCMLKETFLKAQNAADSLTFKNGRGEDIRVMELPNVLPIRLECLEYIRSAGAVR